MKARNMRVLPLIFVLISMLIVTAMPTAAAVDLRGVMDAHAYQNTAISETAFLPYRIYLPDAIAAAFPKSADNAVFDILLILIPMLRPQRMTRSLPSLSPMHRSSKSRATANTVC